MGLRPFLPRRGPRNRVHDVYAACCLAGAGSADRGGDRGEVPGEAAAALAVQIRDRLGEWLGDEQFAVVFGTRGRPGWSPSRLALVTVLQRAEDLTDRAAAEAVRTRIDWQYLLGLGLDDPGFDHTVLSEFRGKVAAGGLEQVALDALLERLAAGGWSRPGGSSAPIPRTWSRQSRR